MKRVGLKRLSILVLVLLVPILLYGIYLYGVKTVEPKGTNEIFEIKNTKEVYNYPDSKVITIMKHYMTTNPPEDLQELKKLVVKFNEDNPIDREKELDAKKDQQYEVYFYRKSKKLPINWQPNEAYMDTDRIGHHTNDCIAVIRWSDSNPKKCYSIMRKSSSKADYGSVIQEMTYYDNETSELRKNQ